MFAWDSKDEIAIWGIGYRGRKLYYRYRNKFKIRFFIDNFPMCKEIAGIPVVLPEEVLGNKIKILIAVDEYADICMQCKHMGIFFYEDFLTWDFFEFHAIDFLTLCYMVGKDVEKVFKRMIYGKKTVIVIGNCQIANIKKLMKGSNEFLKDYIFVDIPAIHMLKLEEENLLKENCFIFEMASLVITQYISENNAFSEFLSTKSVRNMVGKGTKVVVIPTLYFDIYFPQTIHQKCKNRILEDVKILSFPYGDFVLDELSDKYSAVDVVKIVKDIDIFSYDFLSWFYEYRIKELLKRDAECDIQIMDYILKNYRKTLLFYSKNHPDNCVLIELTKRLLEYLGYRDFNPENIFIPQLDEWQEIIYPSVARFLELEFSKETYRDAAIDERYDLEGAVKNYISYIQDEWTREDYND